MSRMQAGYPSSPPLLAIGDESLEAFTMSVLGDTNDYLWRDFQGSVKPGVWSNFKAQIKCDLVPSTLASVFLSASQLVCCFSVVILNVSVVTD